MQNSIAIDSNIKVVFGSAVFISLVLGKLLYYGNKRAFCWTSPRCNIAPDQRENEESDEEKKHTQIKSYQIWKKKDMPTRDLNKPASFFGYGSLI